VTNRVKFTAPVSILNRFRSRQLPRSDARPFSGVRCSQPRLTRGLAANHIRAGAIKTQLSVSFFRPIEARLDTTDSSVSRQRGAAIGRTRRTGSVAHQVYTTVVTTFL